MAELKHNTELIDYIDVVLKRKWLILLATLSCTAGAFWQTGTAPIQYQASALLFVKGPQEQVTEVGSSTLGIQFFNLVAQSDEIRLALDAFRDRSLPGLKGVESSDYSLTTSANETTIKLTIASGLKALVIPMLSAWTDTLIASARDISENESIEFYEFVTGQLNSAINKLEQYDAELEILERDQQIDFLEKEKTSYDHQISQLRQKTLNSRIALRENKAALSRSRDVVQNFEIEGVAIHLFGYEELNKHLSDSTQSVAARQSMENRVRIEVIRQLKLDVVRDSSITLQQFDRENRYLHLRSEVNKLKDVMRMLVENIAIARGERIESRYEVESLQRELDRPIDTSDRLSGSGSSEASNLSRSQSKARQDDLSRSQSRARIKREHANILLSQGEKDLEGLSALQSNLEQDFTDAHRTRERLIENFVERKKTLANQLFMLLAIRDDYIHHYSENKKSIGKLTRKVSTSTTLLIELEKQLATVRKQASSVFKQAKRAIARRERLLRSKETVSSTFNRFSELLEEARIAREKSTSGLRLLTRDTQPQMIQPPTDIRKIILGGGFGLVVSLFLSFLLEYTHSARLSREQNVRHHPVQNQ